MVCLVGLSPRMRGNPGVGVLGQASYGSIPAHAGEPPDDARPITGTWVYPRACGGTAPEGIHRQSHLGLSPRMRGNHPAVPHAFVHLGSIPAHAGEPPDIGLGDDDDWVYPRACGGTPCS